MKLQAWLVPTLLALGVPLATHAQSSNPSRSSADQVDDDETVYLSPFEISSVGVGDYHVVDSGMNRVNRPLIETAASIQVVTSEFIDHIGAGSVSEATQYLSGVSVSRVTGVGAIAESRTLRGFSGDGMFGGGVPEGPLTEPELLERVEILKGPSMFTASSNGGGTTTATAKSPKFESANMLKVEVADQYYGNKVSLDSTGKVPGTERFAYRLIATHRDAHSYLPGRIYLKTINPMLTWKISDKTQLILKGFLHNWGQSGALATSAGNLPIRDDFPYGTGATISKADIKPGYVPFAANGSPDWTTRELKTRNVSVEFRTLLARQLSFRILAFRDHRSFGNKLGEVRINRSSPPGSIGQVDPHTGIDTPNYYWGLEDPNQPWHEQNNRYVSTYVDPSTNIDNVELRFADPRAPNWEIQGRLTTDLSGKLDFGGSPSEPLFSLQGVLGFEWWQRDKEVHRVYSPSVEDITGIYDPTWVFMPNPRSPTLDPNPTLISWTHLQKEDRKWYYANMQIDTFRGRLILSGGIMRRTYNQINRNILNDIYFITNQSMSYPAFSALLKITQEASVYAAYSENVTP